MYKCLAFLCFFLLRAIWQKVQPVKIEAYAETCWIAGQVPPFPRQWLFYNWKSMNKIRLIFCPCYACKRCGKHVFFSLWPSHLASTCKWILQMISGSDCSLPSGYRPHRQTMAANSQEKSSLFQEPYLTNYSQSMVDHSSLTPTQSYILFSQIRIFLLESSHTWHFQIY